MAKAELHPDRTCCDGGCTRGLPCPAIYRAPFAPGVISGPHRRPAWYRRWLQRVWFGLAFLTAFFLPR